MTTTGSTWDVVDVALLRNGRPRGDGDTVNLKRTGLRQLGDDWWQMTDPRHRSFRLPWVDTPEAGHPGYDTADADLDGWILERLRAGRKLRVVVYESAGWDRLLGDLIDDAGDSASQYLMRECGWPLYVKGQ